MQVRQSEVSDIVGHDRLGAAGNRQFDKMIVALITKIGPALFMRLAEWPIIGLLRRHSAHHRRAWPASLRYSAPRNAKRVIFIASAD